jgi:hypothetical protein
MISPSVTARQSFRDQTKTGERGISGGNGHVGLRVVYHPQHDNIRGPAIQCVGSGQRASRRPHWASFRSRLSTSHSAVRLVPSAWRPVAVGPYRDGLRGVFFLWVPTPPVKRSRRAPPMPPVYTMGNPGRWQVRLHNRATDAGVMRALHNT